MIDHQTLLGAAVALFAVAVSAAVLYWPHTVSYTHLRAHETN